MVVVRTWQIFPFDLSGYWSGWETVARVVLGLAFLGLVVDTITRLAALARAGRPAVRGGGSANRWT